MRFHRTPAELQAIEYQEAARRSWIDARLALLAGNTTYAMQQQRHTERLARIGRAKLLELIGADWQSEWRR